MDETKLTEVDERAAALARDPQGGFPAQEQQPPGWTSRMDPVPDHGEETYVGSGKLTGLRALITGGDSGIGRAVAIAYAREGADVVDGHSAFVQFDHETLFLALFEDGWKVVAAGLPGGPGGRGLGRLQRRRARPGAGRDRAGPVRDQRLVRGRSGRELAVGVPAVHPLHPADDLAGDLVAMVHCNNGASELNAWVGLFGEFAARLGSTVDANTLFGTLFGASLEAEPDGGGLLAYNYLSGEHISGLHEGRPLFVRTPDSRFTLANFMRTHLFAALASLRIGMDILLTDEGVRLDSLFAHGGLFKTKGVAQRYLAAAVNAPVCVGDIAGEGGAWGIALLAGFVRDRSEGQSLADYLGSRVFAGASLETVAPDPADVAGFAAYAERFVAGLPVEEAAVEHVR